jgi:hypothetical protein
VLGGGAGRGPEERVEGAGVAGVRAWGADQPDHQRGEYRGQHQQRDEDEGGKCEAVFAEAGPEELPGGAGPACGRVDVRQVG